MDRLERDERAGGECPSMGSGELTLPEWRAVGRPAQACVRVPADSDLGDDYVALARAQRVTVEFPAFMDGRGFSHGRKLRQLGFAGELIAAGEVLADQWQYLERCGYSALGATALGGPSAQLTRFTDAYQSDNLQPLPLFRRRFG